MARQFFRIVSADLWWLETLSDWLAKDDVPADCLSELITKKNRLSVYEAATEDEGERIAAAIALGKAIGQAKERRSLGSQAGIFFPESVLTDLGIGLDSSTPGTTKDDDVNKKHHDLIDLSAFQVAGFARGLLRTSQPQTFYSTQLLKRLRTLVKAGSIPEELLPERVREQIAAL